MTFKFFMNFLRILKIPFLNEIEDSAKSTNSLKAKKKIDYPIFH